MAAPEPRLRTAICVHLFALCRVVKHRDRMRPRRGASAGNEIDCRILPAPIDFDIELDPVTFVQALQARTLDRADMDESIGLTIVARDKAEALHRVEELDRSRRLLASQLALRRRLALLNGNHVPNSLEIAGGNLAATVDKSEFELLAFGQSFQAGSFHRADMDEDIVSALVALDESEALARIEKLYGTATFADDLCRHPAASATAATGAAATESATATAFGSVITAKAVTPTKAITAAETILTTAVKGIEIVFTEPIPLVASPTATTSIKTHLFERTFASPQ